jgi:hypothetical protein
MNAKDSFQYPLEGYAKENRREQEALILIPESRPEF